MRDPRARDRSFVEAATPSGVILSRATSAPGQIGSRERVIGAWLLPLAKADVRQPAELTIALVAFTLVQDRWYS